MDYASADEGGAVFTAFEVGGGAVTIVNNFRHLAAVVDPDWSWRRSRRPRATSCSCTSSNAAAGWSARRQAGHGSKRSDGTESVQCYAKQSDGTETTMDYNIGSAAPRDYVIIEVSGVTLGDVADQHQ